jgi:hypothetical protein
MLSEAKHLGTKFEAGRESERGKDLRSQTLRCAQGDNLRVFLMVQ